MDPLTFKKNLWAPLIKMPHKEEASWHQSNVSVENTKTSICWHSYCKSYLWNVGLFKHKEVMRVEGEHPLGQSTYKVISHIVSISPYGETKNSGK